jgi:uncharacterized membrane protein HdeD (DUF308 family)
MSDSISVSPRVRMAESIGSLWWLPLVRGALLILVGLYALFRPGMTAVALTQVIAIFLIADGVLSIIAGILGETPSRLWTIVRGVVEILIGVFVFGHAVAVAGITTNVILYIIAFGAIVTGILEVIAAIQDRKEIEGEIWMILGGLLTVLFGLVLMMAPLFWGTMIVRLLGIYAIVYGISLIALAFRIRKFGKHLGGSS